MRLCVIMHCVITTNAMVMYEWGESLHLKCQTCCFNSIFWYLIFLSFLLVCLSCGLNKSWPLSATLDCSVHFK